MCIGIVYKLKAQQWTDHIAEYNTQYNLITRSNKRSIEKVMRLFLIRIHKSAMAI